MLSSTSSLHLQLPGFLDRTSTSRLDSRHDNCKQRSRHALRTEKDEEDSYKLRRNSLRRCSSKGFRTPDLTNTAMTCNESLYKS